MISKGKKIRFYSFIDKKSKSYHPRLKVKHSVDNTFFFAVLISEAKIRWRKCLKQILEKENNSCFIRSLQGNISHIKADFCWKNRVFLVINNSFRAQ